MRGWGAREPSTASQVVFLFVVLVPSIALCVEFFGVLLPILYSHPPCALLSVCERLTPPC